MHMRKLSGKAQIVGQVFIYVVAAILFSLIILYGYKAISKLVHDSDNLALVQLKSDLESAVRSVKSTSDVKKKTVVLPSGATKLCFIELEKDAPGNQPPPNLSPLIWDSWNDDVQQNVFLLPQKSDLKIYIGKIQIGEQADPGYLCIDAVNGQITLRLEGKGDRTKISEW